MNKKMIGRMAAVVLALSMLFTLGAPALAKPLSQSASLLVPGPNLLPVQPPVSQFSQEITEEAAIPQEPPADAQQLQDAADKLASTLVTYGAASAQYAVMDGSKIILSGTAGVYSKTENRQLTSDNLYGIGSISKMYAAAAAMKLVEEGRLDLDTPVVSYLPEFKMADERYVDITARMLLDHSSGLYGSTMRNAILFDDNDTFSHDSFLRNIQSQRLKANPGEFSVYCNDGFTLIEILVEKITAKSFTDYLNDTFFVPMAFQSTKTPQDSFDRNLLAKTYVGSSTQALPADTLNAIGAGGIYSNAEELCWFAQVLAGSRPEILSAESAQAMMQPEYKNGIWPEGEDNCVGYGLGWDSVELYPFNRYGVQALTKGGDTQYYHSALVVLPESGLSAAVVTSGGGSSLNTIAASSMLLNLLIFKGEIDSPLPDKSFGEPVKTEMPENIKHFAGIYNTGGQFLNAEISGDGVLTVSYPDMPQMPSQTFTYTEGGGFLDPTGQAKLDFKEESNGKKYLSQHSYSTVPGLGQTAALQYVAEKLEPNPISQQTSDIWARRTGKKYYPLSEKYTSQAFANLMPAATLELSQSAPGYVSGLRITGDSTAQNAVQIPVMAGRDSADLYFTPAGNDAEFLHVRDGLYLSEEGLNSLHGGDSSICTIQPTGYARWFLIADELAGRVMKVSVPQNASFAVYDGNGAYVTYFTVEQKDAVVLPQGAKIVFLGDIGAKFEITLLPSTV